MKILLALLFVAILAVVAYATPDGMLEIIRSQMASGHTEDARTLTESAISQAGDPASRNRAILARAELTVEPDEAVRDLELVSNLAGDGAESWEADLRLGDIEYLKGNSSKAESHWKKVAERASDKSFRQDAAGRIARSMIDRKDYNSALKILDSAISMGASDLSGMLLYYRGLALQAKGDNRTAALEFMKVYQMPGDSYQIAALNHLASIYGKGNSKEAKEWRARLSQTATGTVFAQTEISTSPLPVSAGYAVQLGAFSTRDRAEKLSREMRGKGYNAVVIPPSKDKLFRVRILGYASESKAKDAAAKIKKMGINCQAIRL